MSARLALFGGKPVLPKPLPAVYTIGKEEIAAVAKVMKTGPLSDFVGMPGASFLGGKQVKKIEQAFAQKFKIKHAVSFNSATTALHAAVVAVDAGPGDEVIVPPFSMSASATAILMNGATPIFADIDPKTFCLDPESVAKKITKRTKAIMVVNLFGGPANYDKLLPLAKKHKLKIIEDNAQSPGGMYHGKYTGTIGDIGVFSLNVHKVIQSGEGGVLITNNNDLVLRAQLVRNHGENIFTNPADFKGRPIVGSNYRMTEIEATIGYEQLKKLDKLNRERLKLVDYLAKNLRTIKGITPAYVAPNTKHVFYVYPFSINEKELGISRNALVAAMAAEGFPLSKGYVEPLYKLPIFKTTAAPCPVAEYMYKEGMTFTTICQYPRSKKMIDQFMVALHKVLDNRVELNAKYKK